MIGKRYSENKIQLIEKIIDGEIKTLEEKAFFHCCYFCVQPIKEKMTTLIDGKNKCYLHHSCYRSAKEFYR